MAGPLKETLRGLGENNWRQDIAQALQEGKSLEEIEKIFNKGKAGEDRTRAAGKAVSAIDDLDSGLDTLGVPPEVRNNLWTAAGRIITGFFSGRKETDLTGGESGLHTVTFQNLQLSSKQAVAYLKEMEFKKMISHEDWSRSGKRSSLKLTTKAEQKLEMLAEHLKSSHQYLNASRDVSWLADCEKGKKGCNGGNKPIIADGWDPDTNTPVIKK
jgi:hypothetical protein